MADMMDMDLAYRTPEDGRTYYGHDAWFAFSRPLFDLLLFANKTSTWAGVTLGVLGSLDDKNVIGA